MCVCVPTRSHHRSANKQPFYTHRDEGAGVVLVRMDLHYLQHAQYPTL